MVQRLIMPSDNLDWSCPINWNDPLTDGLVGMWMALQNQPGWKSDTILDLTDPLYGNHGVLTNMDPATDWLGPQGRTGGFGCLDFDGSNDYVSASDIGNRTGGISAITVASLHYARTVGGGSFGRCVGNNDVNPWGLLVQSSNSVAWYVNNYPALSSSIWSLNAWHLVVGTYDGSNQTVYIDGVNAGSSAYSGTLSSSSGQIVIGNSLSGGRAFDGYIANTIIWSRALSATEVAALYQDSLLGHPRMLNWQRRRVFAVAGGGGGGAIYEFPARMTGGMIELVGGMRG